MKLPEHEVVMEGQTYRLRPPTSTGKALLDPVLISEAGLAQPPTTIGLHLHQRGSEITYRWYVGDDWISLTTAAFVVTGRHPHKPQFTVVDSAGSADGKLVTRTWQRPSRNPVWQQELPSLPAAIRRTHQLHDQLHSLVTAASPDDV
ncbi:MAG TPA: hypothetical protein VMR75_03175 [Candidatus Saccharimonadales bacterium]|nr:hypothetical protein [Candidatus Saccharimonadales bacterium]